MRQNVDAGDGLPVVRRPGSYGNEDLGALHAACGVTRYESDFSLERISSVG